MLKAQELLEMEEIEHRDPLVSMLMKDSNCLRRMKQFQYQEKNELMKKMELL